MRQLLINLLLNPIDALGGGGRVVVAVETPDDSGPVRFTVSDNGPGISLGRLEDVFLPFVSTKNGESHHQGLGLSIVYGIVDRAGGSISVENSPEGGCRFSLLLPRWPKEGGSYD
jgi:signal transduction histidine kinase